MWGVHTQFSKRSRAWPCKMGSDSNTSTAARPGRPRLRAAIRASGSINSAREVLTSKAVGFMRERSSSVTQPRVLSARRSSKHSTSLWVKSSALLAETS